MSQDMQLKMVPWGILRLAPNPRPRRSISDEAIEEMAASVLQHGIIQPLLGRPGAGDTVEIYAGQCRYLGFAEARRQQVEGDVVPAVDLSTVPVLVRQIDDRSMLEHQWVENLQRNEVHPRDEAAGYVVMRDKLGYSVSEIAHKLGKSSMYVTARIGLVKVPEFLWKSYDEGLLTISHLEIVGSVPTAVSREEFGKLVLGGKYGASVMSVKDAQETKNRRFCVTLKGCGFDRDDALLVTLEMDGEERVRGGACTGCPHLSGKGGAMMCSNIGCFQAKQDATWRAVKSNAEDRGKRYLDVDQTSRMFEDFGGLKLRATSGLVDLGGRPGFEETGHFGEDLPTWEDLLKGTDAWVQSILARHPKTNRVHQLLERETAISMAVARDHSAGELFANRPNKPQRAVPPKDAIKPSLADEDDGDEQVELVDEPVAAAPVSEELVVLTEVCRAVWAVLWGKDDDHRDELMGELVMEQLDKMSDAVLEPVVAALTGQPLERVTQWSKQALVDELLSAAPERLMSQLLLVLTLRSWVRGEISEEMRQTLLCLPAEGEEAEAEEVPAVETAVVEEDAPKRGGKREKNEEAEKLALATYLETGSIAAAAEACGLGVESVKNWHKRRGWKALREGASS